LEIEGLNNNSSSGKIHQTGIVPHLLEGFETIIPHGKLKREIGKQHF
jgi:hypothetical protein